MQVGVLNEILDPSFHYSRADGSVPEARVQGNPLKGEELVIHWQQLMEKPLFLTVDLGKESFVSELVLKFGEAGTPHTVTVWDADKTRVLCRHCAETGENIAKKELPLVIDERVRGLVIELGVYFSYVDILDLRLFGAVGDTLPVFPIPQKLSFTEGSFPAEKLFAYVVDSEAAALAAPRFAEKLAELTGVNSCECKEGALHFVTDSTLAQNAYRLCVTKSGICLYAADLRGFVYGAENLLKLLRDGAFPCCEIEDAPFMPFRGVHLMLPAPTEMEFARRLVKYVISPMGYNAVILEIAGGMRFDSHPEITEAVIDAKKKAREGKWPAFPHASVGGPTCTEKADVAAFCDYVRSFGIDLIPEVQSLGHVQFMTLAHPDIAERDAEEAVAEIDELSADVPPKKFYAHCYCPSNEKSYEILFDLLDEIVEVTRPTKYVHMGHDEVYRIGVCPKCRGKDPAELFAADVCRIHERLAAKGLKMMIWSDMLQPVTKYLTPAAVDKLPRDIVMMDFIWYFHMTKDIEDNLLPYGYPLVYGNLYSSHFPRYESRIAKQGVVGGQISAWVGTNEFALGKEGKFYDFMYTAQMLWSAEYTSHLRWVYDAAISAKMPALRNILRGEQALTGEEICLLPSRKIEEEAVREVEVNATCRALIFEHATAQKLTRIPWGALDVLGSYRVTYADGTEVEIPLTYGGSIGYFGRRKNEPLKGSYYRHTGYFTTYFTDAVKGRAADGTPTTAYLYEWRNPYPEKEIRSVTLYEDSAYNAQVRLLGLRAVR